jgi:hypothetical protein
MTGDKYFQRIPFVSGATVGKSGLDLVRDGRKTLGRAERLKAPMGLAEEKPINLQANKPANPNTQFKLVGWQWPVRASAMSPDYFQ